MQERYKYLTISLIYAFLQEIFYIYMVHSIEMYLQNFLWVGQLNNICSKDRESLGTEW